MIEAGDQPRIYVDTSVLLAAFEGASVEAERLKSIFTALRGKPGVGVTSELTLAELFGREAPQGWVWQKRFYLNLIVFGTSFDLRPVTREVLIATGSLRKAARERGRKIKLGDAIHAVTAIDAACTHLFTGDKRFVVPQPITRLTLDDADLAAVERLVDA